MQDGAETYFNHQSEIVFELIYRFRRNRVYSSKPAGSDDIVNR